MINRVLPDFQIYISMIFIDFRRFSSFGVQFQVPMKRRSHPHPIIYIYTRIYLYIHTVYFFNHPPRHVLHVTRKSAKLIDFVTSTGAVACSVAFPDGSWAFGNFDASIAQQLVELDANASKVSMDAGFDGF